MRCTPIIRAMLVGTLTSGFVAMAPDSSPRAQEIRLAQLAPVENSSLTSAAQSGDVDQMLAALAQIDMTDADVAQAAAAALIQANPEAADAIGEVLGRVLASIAESADQERLERVSIAVGKGVAEGALATGRTESEVAALVEAACSGIMTVVAATENRDTAGSVALGVSTGVTVQADESDADVDVLAAAAVSGLIGGAAGQPVVDAVTANAVAGAVASGASAEAIRAAAIDAGGNPTFVQAGISAGLGVDAPPTEGEGDTSAS